MRPHQNAGETSTVPVLATPASIATRVGPYRLEQELGAGGAARVFVARREGSFEPVALKVAMYAGREARARFEHEVGIITHLGGHGSVRLVEADEDATPPWAALELVRGESLAGRLRRTARLTPGVALGVATRLAAALRDVHAAGVVHADLKPANVMLMPGGGLKLIDFGTARYLQETRGPGPGIEGSPAYMAPEQAAGMPVDTRTDVFAFGIVLFEMLVGQRPRRVCSVTDHLRALRAGTFLTPGAAAALAALAPESLVTVVHRCLERTPDDRPAGAAEVLRALRSPALTWQAA